MHPDRARLVLDNLDLARLMVARFGSLADEESLAVANEGLAWAASKFIPKRGAFRSFASCVIHNRLAGYFRSEARRMPLRLDVAQAARRASPRGNDEELAPHPL